MALFRYVPLALVHLLLVVGLCSRSASAGEALEIVKHSLATYKSLIAYCERGTRASQSNDSSPFKRCIRADGHFKASSGDAEAGWFATVRWFDGVQLHTLTTTVNPGISIGTRVRRTEYSTAAPSSYEGLESEHKILFLVLTQLFGSTSEKQLIEELASLVVNQAESTAQTYVLDLPFRHSTELRWRIWIDKGDGLIHAVERYHSEHSRERVVLDEVLINPTLTDAMLSEKVSWKVRFVSNFSLDKHPGALYLLCLVVSAVAGMLFWLPFSRVADSRQVRRLCWGIAVGVVVLLGGLFALAGYLLGGGTHLSPMVVVGPIGAILLAIASLGVVFLLATHLTDLLLFPFTRKRG